MSTNVKLDAIQIQVTPEISVTGNVGTPEWWPSGQRVGLILAHDTVGGMDLPELMSLQRSMAERGLLTLRFNFPFAELSKKRPDAAEILERTFRVALSSLMLDPENAPARLVVGGIGLGARVAANVVSQGLKVDGLACLGFPLHPAGKPNQQKVDSLYRIICPMLFVQGSRDTHCRVDRLETLLRKIGAPTRLHVVSDAGQGLSLIKRTHRTHEEVLGEVTGVLDTFIQTVMGNL
ncbi:MAG: hypothetical protein GY725_13200 [bacterium]|nr:hypothetical protein [bacterium]